MSRRWALVVLLALGAGCTRAGVEEPGARTPSPTPTATQQETPSPSPSPSPSIVRVAVKGDFGDGTRPQHQITRRMCEVRETRPFRDVLTTGDNFYLPDGVATRNNYFRPEACLIRYDGHRWRASWGNHDAAGDSTRTVLGAERWYAWSLPGVDFFALNTNQAGSAEQRDWLERRLRRSRAPVRIAYFHAPPYTAGSAHENFTLAQRMWVPLFEEHDVTLVLAGHSHLYEHWRVRGIDYVVTGGGGRFLHRCERSHRAMITCKEVHHFLLVEIEGEQVRVEAIDRGGDVVDRVSIRA